MSVEPKVAGQGMSSAPCFGQTHRIQSGEGVREDQHEVAQIVWTQESRAAPHHRSLQASKSPTLALIAAIKHRTDGVPARLACGNFGRSMDPGSRGRRLAWESGEACRVCAFERWEVETSGQTRKGAMSPRRKRRSSAPLPNHRRAEEGMPCRGTRWVCPQPPPVAAFPGLVSLC